MSDDALSPTVPAPQLQAWLREILRCPSCGATLTDAQAPDGSPELACDGCRLAYGVDGGIPVLLVDTARTRPGPA